MTAGVPDEPCPKCGLPVTLVPTTVRRFSGSKTVQVRRCTNPACSANAPKGRRRFSSNRRV